MHEEGVGDGAQPETCGVPGLRVKMKDRRVPSLTD